MGKGRKRIVQLAKKTPALGVRAQTVAKQLDLGRTNRSKVQVKGLQDRFEIPEGLNKTRSTYFAAVTGGTCNVDVSIGRYI